MSAIQEALERVRRERDHSRQEIPSWVRAREEGQVPLVPDKPKLGPRLGLVLLAGVAAGFLASQVPWSGSPLQSPALIDHGQQSVSDLSTGAPQVGNGVQSGEQPPSAWFAVSPYPLEKQQVGHHPSPLETLRNVADMRQRADPKGAEKELLALLEREPDSVEALLALADLYVRDLSQPKQAIALYERAIQQDPGRASLWVNLGVAYLKTGETARAVEKILLALELDPSLAEAHYNMACALALQGKKEQASRFLERAALLDARVRQWARQDPDLASLWQNLPTRSQPP